MASSNNLQVGLEVETLLSLRNPQKKMHCEEFSNFIVNYYNKTIKNGELGIHADFPTLEKKSNTTDISSVVGTSYKGQPYKEWSITYDATILGEIEGTKRKQLPYSLH